MVSCFVEDCSNSSTSSTGVSYHNIKSEEFIRWLPIIRRHPEMHSFIPERKICSAHFTLDDFCYLGENSIYKKFLKEDAVPTLNLPGPLEIKRYEKPLKYGDDLEIIDLDSPEETLENKEDLIYFSEDSTVPCESVEENTGSNEASSSLEHNYCLNPKAGPDIECSPTVVIDQRRRYVDSSSNDEDDSEVNLNKLKPTDEKRYRCTICKEVFYKKPNLEKHLISTHIDYNYVRDKVFCIVCNRKYQEKKIKRHITTHYTQLCYECPSCSKVFANRKQLDDHEITDHAINGTNVCPVCNVAFPEGYDLKDHLLIHENDEYINCYICSQPFHSKYALTRHISLHTKEDKDKPF